MGTTLHRTTPPRPHDAAAVVPDLVPLARTAIRLHPRPGSPTPRDSSIGGPLLWPADEPWPRCQGPHEPDGRHIPTPDDVRVLRRLRAAAAGRALTQQEQDQRERARAGRAWPEPGEPVAMLPVAQLYTAEVPGLHPPHGADLLQLLWCPFDHPGQAEPATRLHWRTADAIAEPLPEPAPQPPAVQYEGCLPEPCLLAPEQVTEYPDPMELEPDLAARLENPDTWGGNELAYLNDLSCAPGSKAGGWPAWGLTDPEPVPCPTCDARMTPLLTLASTEWTDESASWIPLEDRGSTPTPAMLQVADAATLQLYACPTDPHHPHQTRVQ